MKFSSLAFALGLAAASTWAGNLNPSSGPTGTMATLDAVYAKAEPRTFIRQSDIPLTINTSGSYVVAENLSVATGVGITISTSNVTLDLNGFTVSGSGAIGISVGAVANVRVRNGAIRGFGSGNGISFSAFGSDSVLEDVALTSNGYGVTVASSCVRILIRRCIASGNTNHGISLDTTSDCEVRDCTVASNGGNGISLLTTSNTVIAGNTATANFRGLQVDAASTGAYVEGNRFIANSNTGLVNLGLSGLILGNFAANNGTNYSGVPLVASASTSSGPHANIQP